LFTYHHPNTHYLLYGTGNVETALFWSHRWAENSILQDLFPRLYSIIKENKQASVSETRELIGHMWIWHWNWRRSFIVWEKDQLLELEYVIAGTVVQAGMTDNWEGIHHT